MSSKKYDDYYDNYDDYDDYDPEGENIFASEPNPIPPPPSPPPSPPLPRDPCVVVEQPVLPFTRYFCLKKDYLRRRKFSELGEFESQSSDDDEFQDDAKQSAYYCLTNKGTKDIYQVVDSSDVIIQVLDARDPLGTRCYQVEKHLKENGKHKHMVFVLNRCDLIPSFVTIRWIELLSKEYSTVIFLSGHSNPSDKEALLLVLRQFVPLKSDGQAITVGLVGYPDVGMLSLLNFLCLENACKAAPSSGGTEDWRYIPVDERICVIDCPGLVYHKTDSERNPLKFGARVTNLQDGFKHIGEVLSLANKWHVQNAYKVVEWVDARDFLLQFCRTSKILLKDGEPDLIMAAKIVLHDWQRGMLPFYVPPPRQGLNSFLD